MRVLLVLPADSGARWSGGVGIGGATPLGRLAAYRLGGMLTQSAEFPIVIPGYFNQEIAAQEYGHGWAACALPLDTERRFHLDLMAAAASVTPVARTDPGGVFHAGFSLGVGFSPRNAALHGALAYGYSPTAVRGGRRGGHSAALTFEIDFMTGQDKASKATRTTQEGLGWLLGR
jgi:hypothetical protein